MTRRERVLAISTVILVALVGVRLVWQRVDGIVKKHERRLAAVRHEIAAREASLANIRAAGAHLTEWQRRSLPANPGVATGLYKQWLLERLAESKLAHVTVASIPTESRHGAYDTVSMTVSGRGSVDQFVTFLYSFYRADHLHKILALTLHPSADSAQLEITFRLEALILPGADRVRELSPEVSNRLAHADLSAYQSTIGGRRLFARYTAPASTGSESNTSLSEVYVTGIFDDGSKPIVWLDDRSAGRKLRLREGATFRVGDTSYAITLIDAGRRVVALNSGAKDITVPLGGNLSQARPAATPAAGADSAE